MKLFSFIFYLIFFLLSQNLFGQSDLATRVREKIKNIDNLDMDLASYTIKNEISCNKIISETDTENIDTILSFCGGVKEALLALKSMDQVKRMQKEELKRLIENSELASIEFLVENLRGDCVYRKDKNMIAIHIALVFDLFYFSLSELSDLLIPGGKIRDESV